MILPKYPNQMQYCDEWCWAAVASSVAMSYDPHTQWTQAALAGKFIAATCATATDGNVPAACQQTYDFIQVIQNPGINTYAWEVDGIITLGQFQGQLSSGWAVCCIFDYGSVQHVVAVIGFQDNVLVIHDPEKPSWVTKTYNELSTQGYRGGNCIKTIGTQPAV